MSGTKRECFPSHFALLWNNEASEVAPQNEEEEVAAEDQESIVEESCQEQAQGLGMS